MKHLRDILRVPRERVSNHTRMEDSSNILWGKEHFKWIIESYRRGKVFWGRGTEKQNKEVAMSKDYLEK